MHRDQDALNTFERAAAKRWVEINSGYEYVFWNDDDLAKFIESSYPAIWEDYQKMEPIEKAAIGRLAVVHKFGGTYADVDVFPIRPLDHYIPAGSQLVMGAFDHRFIGDKKGNQRRWITDYQFSAQRGHPFLLACIGTIVHRVRSWQYPDKNTDRETYDKRMCRIFETVSIHCWNEVLRPFDVLIMPKPMICNDHGDWEDPERSSECCSFHYSSESWLQGRGARTDDWSKERKLHDQLGTLKVLKEYFC